MDNMKGGEVVKLFTEKEKEGVKEVNKLWEVEPPSQGKSTDGLWVGRVVHSLANPVVLPAKPETGRT